MTNNLGSPLTQANTNAQQQNGRYKYNSNTKPKSCNFQNPRNSL